MIFNPRKRMEGRLAKRKMQASSLMTYSNPQSAFAEQLRTLRTNIEFVQMGTQLKSLLITSSIQAEGKSTIAANLAIVMGQTDKKVLLVDSDLRNPTVHKTFRLKYSQGLTTLMTEGNLLIDDIIQSMPELNVWLLPSGTIPPNPADLLSSARMRSLMKEFAQRFDLVIYDAPPLSLVTDAQILASRVDGVVIVVRHGYVKKEEVQDTKRLLNNVNANIIGCVINGQPNIESYSDAAYYADSN